MKDDYLWDGTGEPDPEIQRLEQTLGRLRYQPKPLAPVFDQRLPQRRTSLWPRLAAAAAIILMALVGLWVVRNQQRGDVQPQVTASVPDATKQDAPQQTQDAPKEVPAPSKQSAGGMGDRLASVHKITRRPAPAQPKQPLPKQVEPETYDAASNVSEIAVVQPIVIPFVDPETSKHIERSQMLLRSFRNIDDKGSLDDSEVAYEKRQSRGLLYQNIVLRRDAEAKGNLPVGDLLGSLEPFLIDIANLPERPSRDELLAIKERMQKKEIVSALQIYSAPTLGQVFP